MLVLALQFSRGDHDVVAAHAESAWGGLDAEALEVLEVPTPSKRKRRQ
jgi:hypothetical protein